jgi:hypothetical protein
MGKKSASETTVIITGWLWFKNVWFNNVERCFSKNRNDYAHSWVMDSEVHGSKVQGSEVSLSTGLRARSKKER